MSIYYAIGFIDDNNNVSYMRNELSIGKNVKDLVTCNLSDTFLYKSFDTAAKIVNRLQTHHNVEVGNKVVNNRITSVCIKTRQWVLHTVTVTMSSKQVSQNHIGSYITTSEYAENIKAIAELEARNKEIIKLQS